MKQKNSTESQRLRSRWRDSGMNSRQPRILIADEEPIDADEDGQREKDRSIEMNGAHRPHHEMIFRRIGHVNERMTDVSSRWRTE